MSSLRDIYQEVILDHYRKPRNFKPMDGASHHAKGHNPLCGDRVDVFLKLDGEVVEDVSFQGAGCAISTASASLMTEAVKGKKIDDVRTLFEDFRRLVTEPEAENNVGQGVDLGKLEALAGVRELPVRIKCATLSWHTLQAALEQQDNASTE